MAENFFLCVSKDLRRKFTNFASVKRALRLFFYAVQILVKKLKKTLSSVKIVVSFKNEFFESRLNERLMNQEVRKP
jgi:hypothetical protein